MNKKKVSQDTANLLKLCKRLRSNRLQEAIIIEEYIEVNHLLTHYPDMTNNDFLKIYLSYPLYCILNAIPSNVSSLTSFEDRLERLFLIVRDILINVKMSHDHDISFRYPIMVELPFLGYSVPVCEILLRLSEDTKCLLLKFKEDI